MRGAKICLISSCMTLLFYFYIFLCVLTVSSNTLISFLILSCVIFFGLLTVSLRSAEYSTVESVLGPPWGAYGAGSDNSKNLTVIAHRACAIDSPENSITALKKIIKEGITAVEFDVMLLLDNVPIVFHDSSLARMTNDPRMIETLSWKEVQNIDISVKHPFGKSYPGATIPTLNSFIECCLENDVKMLIDIKDVRLVSAVLDAFKTFPRLVDMALISSFNPFVIYKIRAANPSITGCLAWRSHYYSYEQLTADGPQKRRAANVIVHCFLLLADLLYHWFLCNFLYQFLGLSALLLHKDIITRDVIEHWKKRGVRVLAWTVNSPAEKIFFERTLQIPYLTDTVICS